MDAQDDKILRGIRKTILEMVFHAQEGHIPSAFSILEILYILYRDCLKFDPDHSKSDDRDYFVLSKGHGGAGLYAILSHFGFFKRSELLSYCQPGSRFGGHPDSLKVPGVEVCSGSLGHGIAMGVGIAVGLRLQNSQRKVVVLVGDGEMDEGSFWESIMMIKNMGLSNILVIADHNQSQKYSAPFEYVDILKSFGFQTHDVDGHDLVGLSKTLVPLMGENLNGPTFVRARTIKGFGIHRFIGEHGWHRRTPTKPELDELFSELQ